MASTITSVADPSGQEPNGNGAERRRLSGPALRLRAVAAILLALHPIAFAALLLISWEMAVSQLGQDPIPYQHDPKFLGDPIGLLNAIWMVLLMTVIPAFVLSLVLAVFQPGSTRRWTLVVPLAAWVISAAVVVANWDALVWFID